MLDTPPQYNNNATDAPPKIAATSYEDVSESLDGDLNVPEEVYTCTDAAAMTDGFDTHEYIEAMLSLASVDVDDEMASFEL